MIQKRNYGQALIAVMVYLVASIGLSAQLKIGYVDMQMALQKTSAGKAAKGQLEKELTAKKKSLEKKKSDLEKQRDDLQKKRDLLSPAALQQKAGEFQQEMLKYREEMAKGQLDIQKKERELTAPIFKNLSTVINDIAKEQKYDMILEKSQQGIVWAKKNMDLTSVVISRFEKKYGKGKKK